MVTLTEEIQTKNYTREMEVSFFDYAMTTIKNRALPDVRDGLKPVHRRILYGMSALGLPSDKPHKKSARIVGDILGKYHPHGDSSVYDAMVRLAQDFSLYIPLVDGHGNFGSIDGDSAAAMRYTEARLSVAGGQLTDDLEKNVVDFVNNYDDSEVEPVVLPARFPNLLVNGSEGIAVGMATDIPTHNSKEVADAWRYMINYEGRVNEDTLLKKLSAPDYPYGGIIVNGDEVKEFYRTGRGRVIMRGKYHIEDTKGRTKRIVFTELPNRAVGNKNNLINKLIEQVNDGTLSEVTNIVDESSREGMRLVIEVRNNTDIDKFMNKLWLKTELQSQARMQFLVLINGKPETITLERYFEEYIKFQKELHIRLNKYLLEKVVDRLEIVDGLLIAHSVMDSLIDAIRNANNSKALMKCLIGGDTTGIKWRLKKHEKVAKKFTFTKRQAEAILNRRLRTLTGLDIKQLSKEQKKLYKEKAFHESVINDETALKKELIKDVDAFERSYKMDRRAKVTVKTTDIEVLEEKSAESIGVTVDENGFAQTRVSVSGTSLDLPLREDTDTNDAVTVFTSKGNLYQVKVTDIPSDRKMPLQVLSRMEPGERIIHTSLSSQLESEEFFMITKYGKAKLFEGADVMTKGFRSKTFFAKVDNKKKDEIIHLTTDLPNKWLIVLTNEKRGGRIDLKDERVPFKRYGKSAQGSTIVKMKQGEYITHIDVADNARSKTVKTMPDVTGVTVKAIK